MKFWIIIVIAFCCCVLVSVSHAQSDASTTPDILKRVLTLEGRWEAKASLQMGGKSYSFPYRMHFRKTAAGADQNVGRNAIPTTLIVGNNWECTFADEPLRTSIPVKGMHCSSCVSMIKKAVLRVAGVESVAVNLDSGLVVVEYDSSQSLSDVINAITRMGYKIIDADFLRGTEKQQTPLIH